MNIRKLTLLLAVAFTFFSAERLRAQQLSGPALLVYQSKIDIVMEPTSPISVITTGPGKSIVEGVAAYFGVNPAAVELGLRVLEGTLTRKGEETFRTIPLPTGYNYCGSVVKFVSVAPKEGDHQPYVQFDAHGHAIGFYVVTPRQGIGGGRTWIEADVLLIGARGDVWEGYVKEGKCNIAMGAMRTSATVWTCRGPACGGPFNDSPLYTRGLIRFDH